MMNQNFRQMTVSSSVKVICSTPSSFFPTLHSILSSDKCFNVICKFVSMIKKNLAYKTDQSYILVTYYITTSANVNNMVILSVIITSSSRAQSYRLSLYAAVCTVSHSLYFALLKGGKFPCSSLHQHFLHCYYHC